MIEKLNAELDRVGLVDYDSCEVSIADGSEECHPWTIVKLTWGCGETEYFRASDLLAELGSLDDDLDWNDEGSTPVGLDSSDPVIVAIAARDEAEDSLAEAEKSLRAARSDWHYSRPITFAGFRPALFVQGGNTARCYGENGEFVECAHDGKLWNPQWSRAADRGDAAAVSACQERITAFRDALVS